MLVCNVLAFLILSYLILSYLSHDLIIKTADLFGYVRVGVESDLMSGVEARR